MRKYTKMLSLVVAVLMLAALLCGCGSKPEKTEAPANAGNTTMSAPESKPEPQSEAEKMEALVGTWYENATEDESVAQALLESVDLYEEEIACVDLTTLQTVWTVTFTTDKTYQYAYDVDGTKAYARTFLEGAMDAMYENRASLGKLYDADFASASKEEFQQFYAELYDVADFSALLDKWAGECFNYDALAEPMEEGTYSIGDGTIDMTVLGETIPRILKYSIEGDTLTLIYADGVEVYSRSK